MKKLAVKAIEAAAGGAVLTAVACIVAPAMLKTGLKTIRNYASQYYLDPETGMIRRKDENVVTLTEEEYKIHE
ncbi:MAG: hypothetical protein IJ906_08620 [Oscillospiraceae bacterium]|nr:hypothetical protein [Oscillospiraceae bacterium]